MASSSRMASPAKRLLTELQTYQSDPNEALLELGPVEDDELMHWRAVMKGVSGTAYEGTAIYTLSSAPLPLGTQLTTRRPLPARIAEDS